MSLSRFDDGALWHPKAVEAGEDAANLWMRSIIYANRYSTDGLIRTAAIAGFTSKPPKVVAALIASLVTVRLWDVEPGVGWRIHDFLDWNDSRTQKDDRAAAISATRSAAGKAGNRKRWGAKADSNDIANPSQNDRKDIADSDARTSQDDRPSPSVPFRTVPSPTGEEIRTQSVADGLGKTVAPTTPARRPHLDIAPPADGTPAAIALAAILRAPILAAIVVRPCELAAAITSGAYPAVDVVREIAAAEAWMTANPRNAKKDGARFLNGWLTKAQERAPRVPTHAPPVAVEEHDPIEIARQEYRSRLGLAVAS
jgi:hypothetical protein